MKTVLSIKTDFKLKKEVQKLAKEVGVPVSLVVNNALRKFVANRSVIIEAPLKPSKWLQRILQETENDWKEGKNYEGPFSTVEEFMKGLRS